MSQDDKMPAAVLYRRDKDWLYLIESVTNGGVLDEEHLEELEALTKNVDKHKVFVTAFPNFDTYTGIELYSDSPSTNTTLLDITDAIKLFLFALHISFKISFPISSNN